MYISVRLIIQEDKLGIDEAERINVIKLADRLTVIIHCGSKFVDLIKSILSFYISFVTTYEEKFAVSWIVIIVKEMVHLGFLSEISYPVLIPTHPG